MRLPSNEMGHPYRRLASAIRLQTRARGWPAARCPADGRHDTWASMQAQTASVFVIASRARRHNPWSSRKPSPVAAASALPALLAEFLALGAFTGFLAGLLGIGGGILMVPFVTFIIASRGVESGLAVKMAIATSMATILFTSISSLRAHHAVQCAGIWCAASRRAS